MKPSEVRAARERMGLSQAALAEKLGVTEYSVNRWENGARRIREITALAIRRLLDEASRAPPGPA